MKALKPWEQSRTTYTLAGNNTITRDYSVNQTTIIPASEAEIVHEPEEEVKTEEVKPAIVKKVVAKKVKEEIVIRPPEEGTYYKQTIKGKEYLTLAIDGDDMIYVFDLSKKAVGGYDVNKKEIDQSIQVEFEEED